MVRYFADRAKWGTEVYVEQGGRWSLLPHRGEHSPTGFEWGYGGAGPADLAKSILADAVERGIVPREALRWAHDFKWAVIATLPFSRWEISEATIRDWWGLVVRATEEDNGGP